MAQGLANSHNGSRIGYKFSLNLTDRILISYSGEFYKIATYKILGLLYLRGNLLLKTL